MPTIELRADLNSEDDEGRWWSLLRDAVDPSRIVPGAVVVAGTDRYWATVRIEQVDDDGQVHFVEVSDGPEAGPASTATSTVPPGTDESGSGPEGTTAEPNRSSGARSETDRDGPSSGSVPS